MAFILRAVAFCRIPALPFFLAVVIALGRLRTDGLRNI